MHVVMQHAQKAAEFDAGLINQLTQKFTQVLADFERLRVAFNREHAAVFGGRRKRNLPGAPSAARSARRTLSGVGPHSPWSDAIRLATAHDGRARGHPTDRRTPRMTP